MPKNLALTALLLAGALAAAPALSGETAVREFTVEPLTRYSLSFEAAMEAGGGGTWALQVFNDEGLLPFEGVFNADWQRLVPDRNRYAHAFLTPRDGTRLKLVVASDGVAPRLGAVDLQPDTNGNPVINGDFAAGPHNFSGWNTRHLASLEPNGKGGLALRCEPQGYALTDPIPVEPGATYRYSPGSTPGRVLVYDVDLLRTDWIGDYHERTQPDLKMPADAAYIRIAYCDGRPYRAPLVQKVGIERVTKGTLPAPGPFPPYPGEIVLDPRAALPEIRAAREIQHWVRRISGKEMRVLAAPSKKEHMRLFVGRSWAETLYPADLKALEGSDGFAVRQNGKTIHLFGARPAGCLFGAARFLEKNTDLIWARPEKDFGAIFTPDPDLEFKGGDLFLRPAFVQRMSGSPYAQFPDDGTWQGRAGLNTSAYFYNRFERTEMGGAPSFDGNFMSVIAQSERYAFETCKQEHPEFFAQVNGQREIRPNGYICYTAPGIAEAIAEGLRTVIRKAEARGESLEHVSVRTRDGWTVCSCETCMKPIPLPGGGFLVPKGETAQADPLFFSTRMVVMMNKVAGEFAKTHPRIPIGVLAYLYMSVPPAVSHAPNLVPSFCAYDTCSLRFPILDGINNHIIYGDSGGRAWEKKFREYLARNEAGGGQLSMFAYYYCNGFSAVADSAAADWSAMVKSGNVRGVHMDGFTADSPDGVSMWDFRAMEWWIMARLMWEPALDPEKLRADYISRAYGRAAPAMREFHTLIRNAWKDPGINFGVNCHTPGAEIFDALIVKTGHEAALRALLVEAEKKADNPNSRILVLRNLAAYDRFAQSLNRLSIPVVPDAGAEWAVADSPFWMPAQKLGGFKQVSTWDDFKQAPARRQTAVSIMRDEACLYFRFQASAVAGRDRVELVLTAERGAPRYYFALDSQGTRYEMKDFAPRESRDWAGEVKRDADGYTAMFRIPLSIIKEVDVKKEDLQVHAKFSRLSREGLDREESSLNGSSISRTHYMNYWTPLSLKSKGDAK